MSSSRIEFGGGGRVAEHLTDEQFDQLDRALSSAMNGWQMHTSVLYAAKYEIIRT